MTLNVSSKTDSRVFILICLLISLTPVIRLAFLIDFTCSNVITTDFIYSTNFLNLGLSDKPDPILMFKNSSMMGHPQLAPLFFQLLNAKFFSLNAFCNYYLCICLMYVSTLLAFDCLTPRRNQWSYTLLPLLSLLQFSLCLSSEFFYSFSLVCDTLTRLSLALGIWAIARVHNNLVAAILMFVSGCICSTCGASFVVACWSTFGLLLLALRRIERPFLISYLLGLCISALPILLISIEGKFRVDPGAAGLAIIPRFIASVGMAFLNDTAVNVEVGWKSISMGMLGLIFLLTLSAYFIRKKNIPRFVYCCWAFALFGLLNLCCTAAGRVYISAWYCTYSVFIWSSICALAFGVLNLQKEIYPILAKGFASVILLLCLIFYMLTNRSYADKDYFRMFHSPSAESCLRNYKWAPTYAYYQLFGSKMGSLAAYLKFGNEVSLHRLSCFAARQTWSLQGDFILPVVQFVNHNPAHYAHWITERKLKSHPGYSDPEHLTLAVPTTSKVIWTLNFPSAVKQANLHFDLAAASRTHDTSLLIKILGKDEAPLCSPVKLNANSSWHSYSIPFDSRNSAQTTIVLECTNSRNEAEEQVLLKYPTVNCKFDSWQSASAPVHTLHPSNVDNAPDDFGSIVSTQLLDTDWQNSWTLNDIQLTDTGEFSNFVGSNAQARLTYKRTLDIDPSNWTEFFIEFSESVNAKPRLCLCQFFLNNGKMKNGIIPILADEKMHRYCYELKLLQLDPGERITFMQILPVYESSLANSSFSLGKLGFARRLNRCH